MAEKETFKIGENLEGYVVEEELKLIVKIKVQKNPKTISHVWWDKNTEKSIKKAMSDLCLEVLKKEKN